MAKNGKGREILILEELYYNQLAYGLSAALHLKIMRRKYDKKILDAVTELEKLTQKNVSLLKKIYDNKI